MTRYFYSTHVKILCCVLALCLTAQAQAQADAPISKTQAVTNFANGMCTSFTADPLKVKGRLNRKLEEFMQKHEGIAEPTRADKIRVLNHYKNHLICQTREGEINYMHQALNLGKQIPVINGFLIRDLIGQGDQGLIDFNAISIMNGKRMTVLDYLNYRMENSDWSEASLQELKSLKKMLTKYLHAKPLSALSDEEKAAYETMLIHRAKTLYPHDYTRSTN
ncbi:hypothetical protein [Pseudoalteromonas phenolica]|uniref:hypothetical protein n=1 Tax=Pseudoalteromonas phenolica TaxID=161398 RepID=UPI00384AABD3